MKNRHHRKCKVNGGTYAKGNISRVKMDDHFAFHLLFGTRDAYGIAKILNETWIDRDFELIVRRK